MILEGYVTDKNKYYNYNAATSIKQGVYENYNYRSFIQFDKIVEYEKYSKTAASANIVFSNWLNYCVYQNTPYDLEQL